VFASDHLFADDTPVRCSILAAGVPKQGACGFMSASSGHGRIRAAGAVYLYAPDRKAERPVLHLEHFKGVLRVDGYAGFERLTGKGDIVLAACWAHTGRKFYEVAEATGSPVAAEALRRIGELYVIEAEVRGQSPPYRLAARHQRSKPIVDALHTWPEGNSLASRAVVHSQKRCVTRSYDGTD